ncbi:MAG: glycosyltransferase family 4 protein [Thiogranum sp.]
MRILVSTQHFWPEDFRINDLVQALTERGVDVDVLTGKPNYPEGRYYPGYRGRGCQREQRGGASVFRVPLVARGSGRASRLVLNYLSFIFSGLLFAPWLLRGCRYDVIFVYASSPLLQAIPALLLGRLKRCPVVVWVQDLWPESLAATGYVQNRYILAAVRRIVGFIYRHSDLLLVQSRAYLPSVSALAPGKPVVYYPNSVEEVFCEPAAVEESRIPGLDADFPVVFAGNIGTVQAVDVIAEAAGLLKEYPGIHFVVVGEGVGRGRLCSEVQARGLSNVSVPGRYPVAAMPCIFRKASALLVTLTDDPVFSATVPSKLQTYMAAGRPVLASLNGEGARMVTEAGAGLAAPAGDARALSDAVLALFNMTSEERDRLGANGRRYFQQHFDRSLLVDQLLDHFRSVASRKVIA